MKEAGNKRCPLRTECERKCEYAGHELDCGYYNTNVFGENGIPDQEEIRERRNREREEDWMAKLYADIPDKDDEDDETEDDAVPASGIRMIPLELLDAHPDNPRKELGDLTELADSIRERGVMQNLTVVPNPEKDGRYRVIIGHRRCGAARLAGLTSLPCAVVEMTPQEQVATMLLENMQRSDLTVYEQAAGIVQLSMFGADEEEIARMTGFSRTTVKRRLKMGSLNQETLKKVSVRQVTMADLDKLFKIEDEAEREKCLAVMGTNNFNNAVESAISRQARAKRLPQVVKELERLHAVKMSSNDKWSGKFEQIGETVLYGDWDGVPPLFPKKITEGNGKLHYCLEEYSGQVSLWREKPKAEPVRRSAEEIAREKEISELWVQADELTHTAHSLRQQFVEGLAVNTKNRDAVQSGALPIMVYAAVSWYDRDRDAVKKLLGTDKMEYGKADRATVDAAVKAPPEMLAKIIYSTYGDSENSGYTSGYRKRPPEWRENLQLDLLYDWLIRLGYEMSDEEAALRDGSHEIFGRKVTEKPEKAEEDEEDEEAVR